MAKPLFVSIGMILTCLAAFGQFDTAQYTRYRVGDRLPPTINLRGKVQLLCFASESSCYLCMESLQAMESWVRRNECVGMKLFVASGDDSITGILKSKYRWGFDVVADPMGVFHTAFGLLQSPFYFLVSGDGIILAMGTIGSASDGWTSTASLMGQLCKPQNKTSDTIELVKKIDVVYKGSKLPPTSQRQAQTFNSGTSHVVSLPSNGEVAFIEQDSCVFVGRIGKILPKPLSFSVIMTSSATDSCCYIHDEMTDLGSLPFVKFGKAGSHTLHDTIEMDRYPFRSFLFSAASQNGRLLATTITPAQLVDSTGQTSVTIDTTKTIAICAVGREPRVLHFTGAKESIFGEYELQGYFFQNMVFAGDSILLYQSNLSDTIRQYDYSTGLTRAIPVKYDSASWRTAWRRHAKRAGDTAKIDFQKGLGKYVSSHYSLMYDEHTGRMYTSFVNRDHLGSNAKCYLVGPVGKENCRTIALPDQTLPHSIHAGLLYSTTIEGGIMRLVVYRMPRD